MFTKITLHNYGLFTDQVFDFSEKKGKNQFKNIILLYGENNSGKSTLSQAIAFLAESCQSLYRAMEMPFLYQSELFASLPTYRDFLPWQIANERISTYFNVNRSNPNEAAYITYEGRVAKFCFSYTVHFGQETLRQEELLINDEEIFKVVKGNNGVALSTHKKYFPKEFSEARFGRILQMYFGKHTALSCLDSIIEEYDETFVSNAPIQNVYFFIKSLKSISIYFDKKKGDSPMIVPNRRNGLFLANYVYGRYTKRSEARLQRTENALSSFFHAIYPYVEKVKYKISLAEKNEKYYSLFFVEKNNGKSIEIPFSKESTGTKKLLSLFQYFADVTFKEHVAVIDEIDASINDRLLKIVFDSIRDEIRGQLIITTHNAQLISYSNRSSVFLLERDEFQTSLISLSKYGHSIQPGTDIVGRFTLGKYNELSKSQEKTIHFSDIIKSAMQSNANIMNSVPKE